MLTENQILQQGRYRIIKPLGQNGIGTGYEAYDTVLETNVLLKEIPVSLNKVTTPAQMETLKLAFVGEAEFLKDISHDGLVHVGDYFSEIDNQYLVTELVDGEELSRIIEREKNPFTVAEVTAWADQLLDALNYLHTRMPPVIHRDVKPQNIKLSSDGKVKLFAFGISRYADARFNANIKNQTFDHANLHFLPLEQIWEGLDTASRKVITNSYDEKSQKTLEQPADARTDLYALGATLYYLMTGKLPVDALERSIDILEDKSDPLPSPNELNPNIAPEISDVLMKSLEIRRENRFSSAVIMRQVLRTAFARIKEREAKEARKQQENAAEQNRQAEEMRLEQERLQVEQEKQRIEAEQKRLEQEQQLVEQKRLEVEAEQKRQAELVEQQLREAEAQRVLAERRAAEAEKLLLEKEIVLTIDDAEDEDFLQIPEPESHAARAVEISVTPDVVAYSAATADTAEEINEMFAAPPAENNLFKKLAAAAVILLVLGGIGFGVWNFALNKPAEANQAVSTDKPAENKPALSADTATVSNVEPTPEAPAEQTNAPAETTANQPALKNKPLAPQTKKQTVPTPAAKTPVPQKKAVTVDDLIGDN